MRACVPLTCSAPGLYQLFDLCLIKHVLTAWSLTSTLACLVTKQCLMVFGRQTFPVCPGLYTAELLHDMRYGRLWGAFDTRGGGVLPYMGYIGMCGPKGYGFSAVLVINRVSILADFGHFGHK